MLKFIAHTNLFIAVAATAITLGTGLHFGDIGNLLPYLSVIFFATLADYNWHRFLKVRLNIGSATKNEWGKKHIKLIIALGSISTIFLCLFLFYLPFKVIEWLIILGIITLFYSFPFHQIGLNILDARKVPGLKNLLIAFTWTMATFYLPYVLSEMAETTSALTLKFAERFLFIFAITIPFDIKDLAEDYKAGWKTFPVLFGNRNSLIIASFLLFGLIFFGLLELINDACNLGAYAGIITGIYTLLVLHSKNLNRRTLYYPIYVDGAIMLYGFLLIAMEL